MKAGEQHDARWTMRQAFFQGSDYGCFIADDGLERRRRVVVVVVVEKGFLRAFALFLAVVI